MVTAAREQIEFCKAQTALSCFIGEGVAVVIQVNELIDPE